MKLIKVKVIPNAKKNAVHREGDVFKVRVSAPATGGKANKAVIKILPEVFDVKRGDMKIVKGEKAREKVNEIPE